MTFAPPPVGVALSSDTVGGVGGGAWTPVTVKVPWSLLLLSKLWPSILKPKVSPALTFTIVVPE